MQPYPRSSLTEYVSDSFAVRADRMNDPAHDRAIAMWLLLCALAIFGMVVLGGATRLTGSGLSMVEWDPIVGALPPLSQADWDTAFQLYQQSPEFRYINHHMDLEDFKGIFWFEYSHRLLGRFIGMLFFVPMLYFLIKKRVRAELRPKLIAIFLLGGLQGLVGWLMVKSGLSVDPHVSQYRLAAHLGLAIIIYAYILWVAFDLLLPRIAAAGLDSARRRLARFAAALAGLVYVTALSGAFVAGLRAGFIYNTFPRMGEQWVPDFLFALDPWWRNFFENAVTAQFDHRLFAFSVVLAVLALWGGSRRLALPSRARTGLGLLVAALALQVTLGITTLLLSVPVALGVAHQGGALLLLTAAIYAAHALRGRDGSHYAK